MISFLPVLILAILALAAGAAALYFYSKSRALEQNLESALESCSDSLEIMQKRYIQLAELTVQKNVISQEDSQTMMNGINEIISSANALKAAGVKKKHRLN
jgi:hypothetical protein